VGECECVSASASVSVRVVGLAGLLQRCGLSMPCAAFSGGGVDIVYVGCLMD
jgi:hypothetical protein